MDQDLQFLLTDPRIRLLIFFMGNRNTLPIKKEEKIILFPNWVGARSQALVALAIMTNNFKNSFILWIGIPSFQVSKAVPHLPVLIGSGITAQNINDFRTATGFIIGTYFKQAGDWRNDLDEEKIREIVTAAKSFQV